MTTIEIFFGISLLLVIGSGFLCALDCVYEETDLKGAGIIFFFSLIIMLLIGGFIDETIEYRQNEIKKCEYIVSHSGEYLIYGEENR